LSGYLPLAQETKTFIMNYRTGQFRMVDYGYTALAEVQLDENRGMFVGADESGFAYELEYEHTDGATEGTLTGTLTGAGADTLTDSAAAFYTDGDGLKGVPIWVKMTNETIQKRVIKENTATEITVTEKWSPATITGATYYIGPIHFQHRTPVIVAGEVAHVRKAHYLEVLQEPQSVQKTLTVKADCDMAETFAEEATAIRIALNSMWSWAT